VINALGLKLHAEAIHETGETIVQDIVADTHNLYS